MIRALVSLAAGLLVGLLLAGLIMPWLESRLRRAWEEPGRAVLRSARGPVLLLLFLAGAAAAVQVSDLTPDVKNALRPILAVVAILAVSWFAAALARRATAAGLARSAAMPNATLFGHLAWTLVMVLGGLISLATLGISVTPLLTALGVGGLAVALALQPTLTNLFAGIQILASGQVRPGDYVRLSTGDEGFVTDVTWRQTTIRALANNAIVVPNAQLASSVLTNYHLPETEMSVLVPVGVAYDSDLDQVERVTIEVGREVMHEVPGAVPEFDPLIRYNSFGDSSIGFNVVLRAQAYTDQYPIRHEFIKRLKRRYDAEGIVIPFPMRTVVFEGGGPPNAGRQEVPAPQEGAAPEDGAAPPAVAPDAEP